MSSLKTIPFLLIGFAGFPLMGSFVASGMGANPDNQRFEAPARVRSVDVVCKYSRWGIRASGPALTGFIPCVPKEEIAERTGTLLKKVSVDKFTVAFVDVRQEGMTPQKGHVITKLHFVGSDPLATGKTQERYENLTLKPGDRITVRYYAVERDPDQDMFFYAGPRS